jgi:hypothetical protein
MHERCRPASANRMMGQIPFASNPRSAVSRFPSLLSPLAGRENAFIAAAQFITGDEGAYRGVEQVKKGSD